MQQQAQARQKTIDEGEIFEEVIFDDLDFYMGELEQEVVEEVREPVRIFSSVVRRKAFRLEQEAQKGRCVSCHV